MHSRSFRAERTGMRGNTGEAGGVFDEFQR